MIWRRRRHPERRMMQPRAAPIGEGQCRAQVPSVVVGHPGRQSFLLSPRTSVYSVSHAGSQARCRRRRKAFDIVLMSSMK